ncbi:MFS transporter, PPP family, 3-phenylpropionic acid transporter [Paenibacillus sp. UNC496MF]|uniref:MFS transporter n=1 Tax=Paenibacillus sp. UNC496MF TaxID=1502753 RepID=UPI0008E7CA3F|nr:MFS transporter [Paenibacillus sp. UNC496MF]SFI39969.1 MFS transporter, PPP family, 3-phenylpropionic acid transporter [Paenibacillus sp. UNC496MF]
MPNARTLGIIKAFNFFIYGAISIYGTFFPLYLKDAGMSSFAIGLLLAGGPFVSLLANPFWGYWSDRLENARRILLILLIGNAAVMQLVFSLKAVYLIFGFMLLYFFFQSPLFSQSNSLILDVAEKTGRKFGAFRLWGSLGWAVMAVATGPVLERLAIGRLWIAYGIMMVVSIGLAFLLPRGGKTDAARKAPRSGSRQLWGNKPFMLFLAIGVLISIPNSMNNTFVSIYIADLGGKSTLIGWSAFLSSIFEIPVYLLFDRFLRKNERTMIGCLAAVSVLYALRWFLMSTATTPFTVLFIQAMHCLTFAGYYYVGTQLTVMLVPRAFRASGQALYALSWGGVSGIAAGVTGGWIFEQFGAHAMYRISAATALLGVTGFALLYRFIARTAASDANVPGFSGR